MLLQAIARQTDALTQRTSQPSSLRAPDPLGMLAGDGDAFGASSMRMPGARGAVAMEQRRRNLVADPQAIAARVRSNWAREFVGASSVESPAGGATRGYLIKQVALGRAKSAAYLLFGLAEVFNLMEAKQWAMAEAQLALLLVAGEQAAVEEWLPASAKNGNV